MADAARKESPEEMFKALLAQSLSQAGGFKPSGLMVGDIPFEAGSHKRDAAEAFVGSYDEICVKLKSGVISKSQAAYDISDVYSNTLGRVDWSPDVRKFGKSFFSSVIEGDDESIRRRMDDLMDQPAFDQYAPPSLQITDMLAKLVVAPFAMIARSIQENSQRKDFEERLARTRQVTTLEFDARKALDRTKKLQELCEYYSDVASQVESGQDKIRIRNVKSDGAVTRIAAKSWLVLDRDDPDLARRIKSLGDNIGTWSEKSETAIGKLSDRYSDVVAAGDAKLVSAKFAERMTELNTFLNGELLDGPQKTVRSSADIVSVASQKLEKAGFDSQATAGFASQIRSSLSSDVLGRIEDMTSEVNHGVLGFNAQRVTDALNRATTEGRPLNAIEQSSLVAANREADKLLSNLRLSSGAESGAFNAIERDRLQKTTKVYSDLSDLMKKSSSILDKLPEDSEAKAAADKLKDGKFGEALKTFLDRVMSIFRAVKDEPQPA
jgi:hypothetical protein